MSTFETPNFSVHEEISGPVSIPTWLDATIIGIFCNATPFRNCAAVKSEVKTAYVVTIGILPVVRYVKN